MKQKKYFSHLILLFIILALLLAALIGWLWPLARDRFLTRPDRTWQTMQGTGVWRVALDPSFPPFEMLDEQGKPVGFDVELAQALAAQWGLRVEIIALGFDSLLDALQAGRADSVISALPYDERMTQNVAYSPAYFEAGIRLVTRPGSPIHSVAELAGHTLAVEWGSVGDTLARRLQRDHPALKLAQFETPQAAIDALVNGDQASNNPVDALLIDNVTLRQAQGTGAALVAVGPALEANPYVIAAPLRAHDLQSQISAALGQLQANGQLAALEEKWFGPAK
jgi:ABC-type amino acid transport substrate-binding protein